MSGRDLIYSLIRRNRYKLRKLNKERTTVNPYRVVQGKHVKSIALTNRDRTIHELATYQGLLRKSVR